MERLSDNAADIINDLHTERLDYNSEYIPLADAINKLALYEDTKLEPETISKIRDIVLDISGDLDRLRKLAQADREGRCVVLPAGGFSDQDGENALKSAMNTCYYHNNPVTRFVADAVAEKLVRTESALKAREKE